jgi:hypothetical protein
VEVWVLSQRLSPTGPDRAKQGAAAQRLAGRYCPRRLAVALYGIRLLWEHQDGGSPWDLFDLERKFAKASERGAEALRDGRRDVDRRAARRRREVEQAVRSRRGA